MWKHGVSGGIVVSDSIADLHMFVVSLLMYAFIPFLWTFKSIVQVWATVSRGQQARGKVGLYCSPGFPMSSITFSFQGKDEKWEAVELGVAQR